MATREETIATVKSILGRYQQAMDFMPGFMGDGNGVVNTNRENYYWCRYPYSNSPAVPTLCLAANISLVDNFRVIVGRMAIMPNVIQVLWPNDTRIDGVGTSDDPVPPGSTGGYVSITAHAANHQYLSTDPVFINWRQITPLAVYPYSGLTVQIRGGYIPRPGGDVFVANQTLDLTSHVPGSGARYVLISYSSTGAVVATDGTINAGGFAALTAADIPATPAGNWRSCAIALYNGQTAIVETTSEIDFLDLRFPEQRAAIVENFIDLGDVPHAYTGAAKRTVRVNASETGLEFANANIGYISGDISNPPTEAELESLIGAPAALGAGTAYLVKDTSTNRYYLAVSDGTQILYSPFISPATGGSTIIQLVASGAHTAPGWCWFSDPRAIYYNGYTYFGYVDADGDIYVRKYTHSSGIVSAPFDLHPTLQIDDHTNPSLLIRDSDKKLLAAYSQHDGSTIYLRISTNAEDVSAWGSEASLDAQIGGSLYTYPSLIQLTGEASTPIYLFFRDHFSLPTEHPAHMAFSKSTDGGATWAAETLLALMTYHKMAANGTTRIDFAGSNHPQDPDDHGIYHFYYSGGNYYKSDGTQITATLPIATSDMTQVYNGSSIKGWIWDIAIDGSNNPIIVYATFPTEWTDHRYNYARWTGAAWDVHEITAAGGGLYVGQDAYSGGVVLDHTDPQIVYLSKVVSGQWEIYKYVTADGGATWSNTAITTASAYKNIRPVAIRNHASDLKFMWLAGIYTSYTNWNLALLGSAQ